MRLVNSAAANRVPAVRRWARACEDTSMAHAASPASRIRANSSCSSTASGVVCRRASARPPTRASMVPMSPHCRPAASSIARIRNDEVVLPLVPVTPTTARSREGVAGERGGGERHAHPRVGHDRLGHGHLQLALHHERRRAARPPRPRSRGRRRGCRAGRRRAPPGPRPRRGGRSRRWASRRPPTRGRDGAATMRPPGPASISSWRVMRARILPEATDGHHGAMLSVCRENAVMSSNAGAATSPP